MASDWLRFPNGGAGPRGTLGRPAVVSRGAGSFFYLDDGQAAAAVAADQFFSEQAPTLSAVAGAVPITGTAATLTATLRSALRISGEQDVPQVQTRSGRFPVTMLGWFYAVSSRSGAYMGLLSLEEGPGHSTAYNEVGIESGAFTVYDHNTGLLASAGTASTGVWYKVAFVVTSGAFELYVGQAGTAGVTLIASGSMTNLPASNDYQGIGGTQFTSTEWFDGRIMGARIWNAALTEAEIEAEFRSDTPVKASPLGAWIPPSVTPATALTAIVGADLIDGNGGGIPDYTVESGAPLDPPVGSNTTLTANSGTVPITGTAASLERGLKLTAASGAVPLTGTAASLELGRRVIASSGAVAVTGSSASLLRGSKVAAALGNVPITGSSANLLEGRRLIASSANVPISGTAATLRKGINFPAASGAIPISGTAAAFRLALRLQAAVGAVGITGTAASLERGLRVSASSGNVPINGTAVTLVKARALAASSGNVPVTGTAAALLEARKLAAAFGAVSVTGTAAALKRGLRLAASSGNVPIAGTAANLRKGIALPAAFGAVAITGTAVTFRRSTVMPAAAGAVPLTGTAARLLEGRRLACSSGTVPLTGSSATLAKVRTLTAAAGSVSISGTAAALRRARRLAATSGTVPIVGTVVDLVYTPNAPPVLEPASGAIPITGSAVAFRLAYRLAASSTGVPITGSSVIAGPLVLRLAVFDQIATCEPVEELAELVPQEGINAYARSATPETGAEPQ